MPTSPRVLYKYATSATASKVLKTQSLRWSHLGKFNDPLELQANYSKSLGDDALKPAIIELLLKASFGSDPLPEVPGPGMLTIAKAIRCGSLIKTPDQLRSELEQLLGPQSLPALARELNVALERDIHFLIAHSRVLCLSESLTSAPMWAHYAKEGTGVAFGFEATPASDWMSLVGPVVYENTPRSVATVKEWAEILVNRKLQSGEQMRHNLFMVKAKSWEYEKEWRGVWFGMELPPEDANGFLPKPLGRVPLVEICFGLRCHPRTRARIRNAAVAAGYSPRLLEIVQPASGIELLTRDVRL